MSHFDVETGPRARDACNYRRCIDARRPLQLSDRCSDWRRWSLPLLYYGVLITPVSPHPLRFTRHQGVSARRARAPGGPGETGALEGVPRAARNRILGAGGRRERRARGRRRTRQNARSGLAAVFWVGTAFFFGCELVPRVRVDARSGFIVRRRVRDEPRTRAERLRRSPETGAPDSWGVVPAT